MPNKTVSFVVKGSAGVQAFWIAVGNRDVTLVNGKGSISLPPGEHRLVWWFAGEPGGRLAIVGKAGSEVVVEVKKSQIPDDAHTAAGQRLFAI